MATTAAGDGTALWWESLPGAPPVLLIPGRGDTSDLFPARFVEGLRAGGAGVVRFDPRDTGLSGDGGDAYTLGTMADDALAVLDAAAVGAAHLVGVSMAGLLMVDLACRHPERVASLTFVSAMSPDPAAGMGDDFFAGVGGDPLETTVAAMGELTASDRAWAAARLEAAVRRAPLRPEAGARHQAAAFRLAWSTLDDLARIDAPAVVVHGALDRVLPTAHARALAGGIAGASLHLVDGMGHLPRPRDWDLIARLVLDRLDARGGR